MFFLSCDNTSIVYITHYQVEQNFVSKIHIKLNMTTIKKHITKLWTINYIFPSYLQRWQSLVHFQQGIRWNILGVCGNCQRDKVEMKHDYSVTWPLPVRRLICCYIFKDDRSLWWLRLFSDSWCVLIIFRHQIAKSMGPTWGPPGSCRPQVGHMTAP